jgi:hypothetical protein
MVMRRNPLATAALSVPAAGIMHITVAAIFTVRHWYERGAGVGCDGAAGLAGVGSFMTGVSGW